MHESARAGLATRVRTLRIGRGWRQIDLAEKSGISLRTIIAIEGAENDGYALSTIVAIANAFDVNVGRLLDEDAA